MILILLTCLSTTNLQIGEGSWTSPDIRLTEDWQLDPYEYIEPTFTSLGHISCISSEDGYEWNVVLAGEGEIFLIRKSGIVARIPYHYEPEDILRFSQDGSWLHMYDAQRELGIRINLTDQSIDTFSPFPTVNPDPDQYRYAGFRIMNDGSVLVAHGTHLRFYDSDLNLVTSLDDLARWNRIILVSEGDERVYIANVNEIMAYEKTGGHIWTTEIDVANEAFPYIAQLDVSPDGSRIFVIEPGCQIMHVLDGSNGAILETRTFEEIVGNIHFSPSSKYMVYNANIFPPEINNEASSTVRLATNYDDFSSTEYEVIYNYRLIEEACILKTIYVTNRGMLLCILRDNECRTRFRLVLLSSECEPLWYSEPNPTRRSGSRSILGIGGILDDGSGLWYFDGNIVHFYNIEEQ